MASSSSQKSRLSSFGQLLRMWRKRKGFSQLQLSQKANTTPRYISFIETGRSRPGREVILRIASALDLSMRESNLLLVNAGIASEYIGHEMSDQGNDPFLRSVQTTLDNHMPNPACAVDTMSRILMTNETFELFLPGLTNRTAEQSIDDFFGSQRIRDFIENWEEVAWAFIDRRQFEAVRSSDPRLLELSERALAHMEGIQRPPLPTGPVSMVMEARFRVGREIFKTYMSVLRYESVERAALSELRLELFHPADQLTADYFRKLVDDDQTGGL